MNTLSMIKCEGDYTFIKFQDSLLNKNFKHATHCLIYCLNEFGYSKASISMLLRSDGCLGFPGGKVDEGESVLIGMNRELVEEINLDMKHCIVEENYLFSHLVTGKNLCLHFYAKEVSSEDFLAIEKDVLNAAEYGHETLGLLRVPLYTRKDNYRGLPAFLSNNFAANSKHQLLNFLLHAKLLSREEIDEAVLHSIPKKYF